MRSSNRRLDREKPVFDSSSGGRDLSCHETAKATPAGKIYLPPLAQLLSEHAQRPKLQLFNSYAAHHRDSGVAARGGAIRVPLGSSPSTATVWGVCGELLICVENQ
jgi:hypothetical protein